MLLDFLGLELAPVLGRMLTSLPVFDSSDEETVCDIESQLLPKVDTESNTSKLMFPLSAGSPCSWIVSKDSFCRGMVLKSNLSVVLVFSCFRFFGDFLGLELIVEREIFGGNVMRMNEVMRTKPAEMMKPMYQRPTQRGSVEVTGGFSLIFIQTERNTEPSR